MRFGSLSSGGSSERGWGWAVADATMQERFLATGGQKLPPKPSKQSTPKQGKRPKAKSTAARERDSFLWGVMAAQLRAQELRREYEDAFNGFYRCECNDYECHSEIEGFEEAMLYFQPGHVTPRKSGKGFRYSNRGQLGVDDPLNVRPISPACNLSEHLSERAEPEWSSKEAS